LRCSAANGKGLLLGWECTGVHRRARGYAMVGPYLGNASGAVSRALVVGHRPRWWLIWGARMVTVVNPTHWLNSDGSLPIAPTRLRANALLVAQCIEYGGPLTRGHARETLISCRRRPKNQRCPGPLWVLKQSDDAILAFCGVCKSDEFLICEWELTAWAAGPTEPVDIESMAGGAPSPPRNEDEREIVLQRAVTVIGSTLSVDEIKRVIEQSSHPSAVIKRVLASARSAPTRSELERFMTALMDVWNATPRVEIGGMSPTEARVHTESSRASPRVGRNDPCPCGSGQKYKRCCLRDAPN
jgi:hypothetical protein